MKKETLERIKQNVIHAEKTLQEMKVDITKAKKAKVDVTSQEKSYVDLSHKVELLKSVYLT